MSDKSSPLSRDDDPLTPMPRYIPTPQRPAPGSLDSGLEVIPVAVAVVVAWLFGFIAGAGLAPK